MNDAEYVQFLRTVLPRLGLRWQGFRKVRRQVIKRIKRRLRDLHLADVAAYLAYLESHPHEWRTLDGYCRVTMSRFYRDPEVFETLRQEVLPALAQLARAQQQRQLRCWSIGCASGEEVYTLELLWHLSLLRQFGDVHLHITATDADSHMLERARIGRYAWGSVQQLPPDWIAEGFDRHDDWFVVRQAFRDGVCFLEQDIRQQLPAGRFHLVMCRNLTVTYFVESLQREILRRIVDCMVPGGILVVGQGEALPQDDRHIVAYGRQPCMFRLLSACKPWQSACQ